MDQQACVWAERGGAAAGALPGGEASAEFRVFLEHHYPPLVAALWMITLRSRDAHDLAADAAGWAWRHWPELRAAPDAADRMLRLAARSDRVWLRRSRSLLDAVRPAEHPTGEAWRVLVLDALSAIAYHRRRVLVLVDGVGLPLERLVTTDRTDRHVLGARLVRARCELDQLVAGRPGDVCTGVNDGYQPGAGGLRMLAESLAGSVTLPPVADIMRRAEATRRATIGLSAAAVTVGAIGAATIFVQSAASLTAGGAAPATAPVSLSLAPEFSAPTPAPESLSGLESASMPEPAWVPEPARVSPPKAVSAPERSSRRVPPATRSIGPIRDRDTASPAPDRSRVAAASRDQAGNRRSARVPERVERRQTPGEGPRRPRYQDSGPGWQDQMVQEARRYQRQHRDHGGGGWFGPGRPDSSWYPASGRTAWSGMVPRHAKSS